MAVPRRKEQSRVGPVALVAVAMMASIAFTSLIPSPEPKASPSSTANWRHKYNNAGKNWRHTGDVWRYGLRLLVTAVAAEAPYDKIVTGRWWDWSVMNPIFGLLIALVVCALAV